MPNELGIIISDGTAGKLPIYGLTPLGGQQVRESAERALHRLNFKQILIVYSPFSRTKETAEIAATVIGADCRMEECADLRERFFGDFEGQSSRQYETVWQSDERDDNHTEHRVESVRSVCTRMVHAIEEIESRFRGVVILVSHGDVLQIGEAAFRGMQPHSHRRIKPLENGEIRLLHSNHSL